ncbi:hypothetical protein PHYSODRAFT_352499 [Phytophthora sojae]|uniref:Uncharacterized protein n=1 Tax=Phytophthora sojae (strain P6497) TaxID=1094619 RepID=G5A3K1_PHYSP|nr:hypothetical protein PHYSODRAFT_352499 [Phytophthora sojae]EGZ09374.1 hypothetical protein PHYSODRAFT_352499 [Phytophthora sojae]|eukprot:XP_009534235.1 hypothetical protein PHYSODRAFT_352499 [Phytophthora sojae]
MQQAEKRLLKALKALKRALQVAEASRELHTSPLALADASPSVSAVLTRVVSSCNDVGPLMRKLHHAVNLPGAAVADEGDASSKIRPFARETRTRAEPLPPRRPSSRKRKAPERYLDPLSLPPVKKLTPDEVLEKRLALAPRGEFGSVVRSCLLAVRHSLFHTAIAQLQETCRTLADAKDRGADIALYMDNIQAAVTSTVLSIVQREIRVERSELRAILVLMQRLPREFPETAKLRRYISTKYETPADEKLCKMLVEVRGWCRDDTYSVSVFENRLQFVKETMEGLTYEGYEPHWDRTIAELLFRLGCCLQAFGIGWSQDQRYDTIRSLLYEMKSAERRH